MKFLIFPTQLFENISPIIDSGADEIFMIEECVYFKKYKFHKLKLAYHRASMRAYSSFCAGKLRGNIKITYIDSNADKCALEEVKENVGASAIMFYDPVDHEISAKIKRIFTGNALRILPSPYFPETKADIMAYKEELLKKREGEPVKSYTHDSSFYRWQRRRMNLLMKGDKPEGGKWTYDDENRERFPKEQKAKEKIRAEEFKGVQHNADSAKHISEAVKYVESNFKGNPGRIGEDGRTIIYAITSLEAKAHMREFVNKRLKLFGKYQDGASRMITFGYHSVLSSALNIGILTVDEVVSAVLEAYKKRRAPINSVEGFLRQLVGWRSYCHMIYEIEGEKIRGMNFMGHKNRLSRKFWWGGDIHNTRSDEHHTEKILHTQIYPIDDIIRKVEINAYAHHIERLMYLGGFMMVLMIDPNDVFEWFISYVSIDAYDWVMVPNIYGMSQYADGGLMMTRPYFSSSNYIKKMSDYDDDSPGSPAPKNMNIQLKIKGRNENFTWEEIWDNLYYNFVYENSAVLEKIYSTASAVAQWRKKSKAEQERIRDVAGAYIAFVLK